MIFAVLSIHTYPACHSTGSVIIEMTSFEDEELAMIAIILDEEEEEQRKKTRVWVHNEGKKRDVEGEFATLYKEPETLTLFNSKTIADQQKQIADLESASKNSCIAKLNGQNFRFITLK